jgi:hypothetical protein
MWIDFADQLFVGAGLSRNNSIRDWLARPVVECCARTHLRFGFGATAGAINTFRFAHGIPSIVRVFDWSILLSIGSMKRRAD